MPRMKERRIEPGWLGTSTLDATEGDGGALLCAAHPTHDLCRFRWDTEFLEPGGGTTGAVPGLDDSVSSDAWTARFYGGCLDPDSTKRRFLGGPGGESFLSPIFAVVEVGASFDKVVRSPELPWCYRVMTMHSALAAVARMENKGLLHCDFGEAKQLAFSLQRGAKFRVFVVDVGATRERSHGSYPSGSGCSNCTATCRSNNPYFPGAQEENEKGLCAGNPEPKALAEPNRRIGPRSAESCSEKMFDKQMLAVEEAPGPEDSPRLLFQRTRSMVIKLALGSLYKVVDLASGAGDTAFKNAAWPVVDRLRQPYMSAADGMAAVLEMGAKIGPLIGTNATVAECVAAHATDFDRLIDRTVHAEQACKEVNHTVTGQHGDWYCIDGVQMSWMSTAEVDLVRKLLTKKSGQPRQSLHYVVQIMASWMSKPE